MFAWGSCYTPIMQVVLHPHAAARLVERGVKEEEVIAVEEPERWLVVTVIARYF